MTTREALHHLVDELPEEQAELAGLWLKDLRYAAGEARPPVDVEARASIDRVGRPTSVASGNKSFTCLKCYCSPIIR